jgi:hypothetical protein
MLTFNELPTKRFIEPKYSIGHGALRGEMYGVLRDLLQDLALSHCDKHMSVCFNNGQVQLQLQSAPCNHLLLVTLLYLLAAM